MRPKILVILILVLIGIGSFIKLWIQFNIWGPTTSTYTGLKPFKLWLGLLRITTQDDRFYGVLKNELNDSVTITHINLTNIGCYYGHHPIPYKLMCWLRHHHSPSCVDNYETEVNGIKQHSLPIIVGPNEEFSLESVNCEAIKPESLGDGCWFDLTINYTTQNKSTSTWGRLGTYCE